MSEPPGRRASAREPEPTAPLVVFAHQDCPDCDREGDSAESLCKMPDATNTQTLTIMLHDATRACFCCHGAMGPKIEDRVLAADANGRAWRQYELKTTAPTRP